MAWLIAMNILSDESAGIVILFTTRIGEREEFVQPANKRFLATHQTNKVGHVLWHVPVVLPGIALGIGIASVGTITQRVERLQPFPVTILSLKESIGRIEQVAIKPASLHKAFVNILLSQSFGKQGHTPVIERLLQSDRYRLRLDIFWHITILFPSLKVGPQV